MKRYKTLTRPNHAFTEVSSLKSNIKRYQLLINSNHAYAQKRLMEEANTNAKPYKFSQLKNTNAENGISSKNEPTGDEPAHKREYETCREQYLPKGSTQTNIPQLYLCLYSHIAPFINEEQYEKNQKSEFE